MASVHANGPTEASRPPRLDDPAAATEEAVATQGEEGEQYEDNDDYYYYDDEDDDDDDDGLGHVEDADWDLRTGDFTKAFNRARQTDAALRGPAASTSQPSNGLRKPSGPAPAPLPAMNLKHRRPEPKEPSGESKQLSELSDRLNALAVAREEQKERYDVSQSVGGQLGRSAVPRKAGDGPSASGARRKDKSDRATHQAVFDPRTLLIIYKMIQSGLLGEVHGVVSTGKEANVYHAYEGPRDADGKPIPVPQYGSATLGGTVHRKEGEELPRGLALKVYKTAQLSFKDRGIYTKGDTRFEHGYQGNNSRKMVSQWASKEDRNLRRLLAAGLRAPQVVEHKDNVLVMEFLGNRQGWASPRLRDAEATIDAEEEDRAHKENEEEDYRLTRWTELYAELLAGVRIMYQQCRLVHADLSEYNILYHENHLWIIDVSQSVQHDHESAFDFLRLDLEHVDRYFARHGVPVLGLRKSFDFVISEPVTPLKRRKGAQAGLAQHMGGDQVHEEALLDSVSTGTTASVLPETVESNEAVPHLGGETEPELMRTVLDLIRAKQAKAFAKAEQAVDTTPTTAMDDQPTGIVNEEDADAEDAVFKSTYIPRTLDDVYDAERDAELVQSGQADQLVYAKVTGLDVTSRKHAEEHDVAAVAQEATYEEPESGENGSQSQEGECEGEDDESDASEDKDVAKQPRGHRHEDRDAKKERKQAAKEAQREKRKTKMPKKDKKARVKKTAGTKR